MKIRFLVVGGKVPPWVATAREEYVEKIGGFLPMDMRNLKTPAVDREQASVKIQKEGEIIIAEIGDKDSLILFDERGKLAKTSEDFAVSMGRVLESGKQRVVFCIGGAYGFSDAVYERADMKWSLSALTLNHWLAQLVALEQLYRALTILKGIPYHNR